MSWTTGLDVAVAVTYIGVSTTILARMPRRGNHWDVVGVATALTFVVLAIVLTALRENALVPSVAMQLADVRTGNLLPHVGFEVSAVLLAVLHLRRDRMLRLVVIRGEAAMHAQAQELHDSVVQDLAVAQMALDLGTPQKAEEAIQSAFSSARRIVGDLAAGVQADDAHTADRLR